MSEKKYCWLKQYADFFLRPEIKKLRKIAGGDTYTIIYQKLMLISIKADGCINLTGIEPTIEEELALIIDESVEDLKVVMAYLKSLNLVELLSDKCLLLPAVIPLIGSETSAAERMRAHRARKIEAEKCNNVTHLLQSVTPKLQTVTQSKSKSKSKIRDREEKENKKENETLSTSADAQVDDSSLSNQSSFSQSSPKKPKSKVPKSDILEIFNHWVKVTGRNAIKTKLDSNRERIITRAVRSYGYDKKTVLNAISGVLNSTFHSGNNPEGIKYNDLGLILRDAAHIERFLEYYNNPPVIVKQKNNGVNHDNRTLQERSDEAFNRVGVRIFREFIDSRKEEESVANANMGLIPPV